MTYISKPVVRHDQFIEWLHDTFPDWTEDDINDVVEFLLDYGSYVENKNNNIFIPFPVPRFYLS